MIMLVMDSNRRPVPYIKFKKKGEWNGATASSRAVTFTVTEEIRQLR